MTTKAKQARKTSAAAEPLRSVGRIFEPEGLIAFTQGLQSTNDAPEALQHLCTEVCAELNAGYCCALESVAGDEFKLSAKAEHKLGENAWPSAETIAHFAEKVPADGCPKVWGRDDIGAGDTQTGLLAMGISLATPAPDVRTVVIAFSAENSCGWWRQEGRLQLAALSSLTSSAMRSLQISRVSEINQRRAEDLVGLALEMSSSLSLNDLVSSLAMRAAKLLDARSSAVGLCHEGRGGRLVETLVLRDPEHGDDAPSRRALGEQLSAYAATRTDSLYAGSTESILAGSIKARFGWDSIVLARLTGIGGELLGFLCLADCRRKLTPDNLQLLHALAAHASIALENSRLFSRIAQSNRQWAELFDSISDYLVVHDDEHLITRVNRPMAELAGRRPAELIGLHSRKLLPQDERSRAQSCPFCEAGMYVREFTYPGTSRTYLLSTSRLRGPASERLEIAHVLKDVTDWREAERRYRELFNNVQEGIFFSTPNGRFVDVNDALVRMLGYASRQELTAIDIPTQFYAAQYSQKDIAGGLQNQHGTSREVSLQRKNGSVMYALEHSIAVFDEHGNVTQYQGLVLDITETRNFQMELQRQRDFNTQILNNTQSMILVVDTAGLISYVNRRGYEATNVREGTLVGRQLRDFLLGPDQKAWDIAFAAVLRGDSASNLELQLVISGGQQRKFSANLSPMRGEQQDVNSVVVAMTDITEEAAIQAKLMQTEKMAAVGQLVSGVAHEVNNPLTAIMGFADLMLENPALPAGSHAELRVILHEAQRTKEIVQNLLSFARQAPKQRQAVDVNAVLRKTVTLRSYDLSSRHVEVIEQFDETLPAVMGDAHQLQQVFLNILNNAYDAVQETDRRGRVEIRTRAGAGGAEITFRDNGPGIKQAERIFDPFFTTKELGKGTGLGLSICYGIIRQHGGEIMCRNNVTAPGASFTIKLPLAGHGAQWTGGFAGGEGI